MGAGSCLLYNQSHSPEDPSEQNSSKRSIELENTVSHAEAKEDWADRFIIAQIY